MVRVIWSPICYDGENALVIWPFHYISQSLNDVE
jgi:hypothetical protein